MTKPFAASMHAFGARCGASCGAAFSAAGAYAGALVLGIALAVSFLICGLVGIVRLLSLVILISLLVGSPPRRLRTAA